MFYPFTAILFFFFFLFLLGFLFIFIHLGLITIAFESIGLGPAQVFSFLLLSLIGSYINIPIKKIPGQTIVEIEKVRVFGVTYKIPKPRYTGTVIAINVGGALVPLFLSIYLMIKWNLFIQPAIATFLVAIVSYKLAKPIEGMGIAIPIFIPPILAALSAYLIAPSIHTPVVAYVAGTMGTLIGADIMHLKDVNQLKAPVVSIGGAGTFDGIFLAGIIAVLLA